MTQNTTHSDQEQLIDCFARKLERQGTPVRRFDTHISVILVAGADAYKFKKVVHFDFVDFSTLAARCFYCNEEVRLNRRLAPDLYLGVIALTGDPAAPLIDGPGAPLEYAVHMCAFAQQALWSARIGQGLLDAGEIDQLACALALFHRSAAVAPATSGWGTPAALRSIADDNLDLLGRLAATSAEQEAIAALKAWQLDCQRRLADRFERRRRHGFVRECHGDLHSGNILTVDGRVEVFDCIEFNESLRWIDVINDIAFTSMDLQCCGLPQLAARLLNAYLEASGDYAGLAVLRYYQTELALVRWKIALLRARQLAADGADAAREAGQAAGYMAYALRNIAPAPAAVLLMHGYSGSGKSTFARCLVELLGAICVRSDVERKRMHGIEAGCTAAAPLDAALYRPATTAATYARLRKLAADIVRAGLPVIVDATFLHQEQRAPFAALAAELGLPFFIVDIRASEATLRARLAQRARGGGDPSDAGPEVLDHQLALREPLSAAEAPHLLVLDSEAGLDPDAVRRACAPVMAALAAVKLSR